MKNWYDDLTPEQEEQLKTNDAPQGLSIVTDLLATIPKELRQYWVGDKWSSADGKELWYSTYRLNPSWQRPKKPGRVSYPVALDEKGRYSFRRCCYGTLVAVTWAPSYKGYLGIEFEELPGRVFGSWPTVVNIDFKYHILVNGADISVGDVVTLTPVKVWFKGEA